jgi:hypothetical protein
MWNLTAGVARERLSPRERIDQDTVAFLRTSGTLITDERRRRPLYFDGRFLAARDLTREQRYFLARQSDLGRATGAGVVHGLMAAVTNNGSELAIGPGHGVTDSGESVIVPGELKVPLANVVNVQRLDASFGISRRPSEPPQTRTGLYVVALRPVEFTASPIASYPTSITDPRHVEDGDIVDAVVVSLIPYPDDGMQEDRGMRRARVARSLFVENEARGLPVDALPLAMVLLDRGIVRWLDVYMVRREVGSSHGDVLGFGFAPRAVREAHVVQYDGHLADVLHDRKLGNRGMRFAATDHFAALPPAGRMPASAINTADFTQTFFPPEVDVDLSIVPEDEIAALLEESMLLPPIDLTMKGDALESTSVLVLLPVKRQHVRAVRSLLTQLGAPALVRTLRAAAPGMIAQRKPLEVLQGLRLPRLVQPLLPPGSPAESAWASAIAGAAQQSGGTLWYVRRRNLEYRSDLVGRGVRVASDDRKEEKELFDKLRQLGWYDEFNKIIDDLSTTPAAAEMVSFFAAPKMRDSVLMFGIAFREVTDVVKQRQQLAVDRSAPRPPTEEPFFPILGGGIRLPLVGGIDPVSPLRTPPLPPMPIVTWTVFPPLALDDVVQIESRYGEPAMGDGLRVIEPAVLRLANAELQPVLWETAIARVGPDIDRIGDRLAGDDAAIESFAKGLIERANDKEKYPKTTEAIQKFVSETLGEVQS